MEVELLEVVEGGGSEPAVQRRGAAHADGEAADGAPVRGEYAGDPAGGNALAAEVEAERSGGPDVAPPGGEDLRAAAVLGGETRDDLAEDGVG